MGLLSADLELLRSRMPQAQRVKAASASKQDPVESFRASLELYAGASSSIEKVAAEGDHARLWSLHAQVEAAYRGAVKVGKRLEADKVIDKFAGWTYLKGQPGEPGDLHPLPAPEEK